MLLKHYLDRGVSKAELSRRFGVNRRTIHNWVDTGQLDRDLAAGARGYSPRPPVADKLDPYKAIIDARLEAFPKRPIRYIRESFFYGRSFANDNDLNEQAVRWLEGTANVRRHATTASSATSGRCFSPWRTIPIDVSASGMLRSPRRGDCRQP